MSFFLSLGIYISDSASTRSILPHQLTLVPIKFSIKTDEEDRFMFLHGKSICSGSIWSDRSFIPLTFASCVIR